MKSIDDRAYTDEIIDKMSRTFSILGDTTRLRMIFELSKGQLCVADLSGKLGLSQSAVSHQLRPLKDLDLVKYEKDGRNVYYQLNDEHIENLFKEGLLHVLDKLPVHDKKNIRTEENNEKTVDTDEKQ
jgi:DNA-binding transcriptional ArsR family regulator